MSEDDQINLANIIKVEIEENNMKAFLTIKTPEADQIQIPSYVDVLTALEKRGIKFGIKNELIDKIIDEKKFDEKYLIAEGTPSIPGEDAKLEYYFPTDQSLRPQIKEDGHIDYREISTVNSVEKDAILVKKIRASAGPVGTDVLGNELPPKSGKDINLPSGKGFYKDSNDPMIIRSFGEGVIFYDLQNNIIEVQQLFLVPGSVDYSTGNMNVKSSIEIKGDVKPDFSVTTPYNIQVNGVVEQATITCGGALNVRVGIKGDAKRIITVGGDIHTGYINNQIIKSGGSVYASTEIRNSFIECADEVVLVKSGGVIIGGKITATKKITAAAIGNLYNTPTEIEVGVNLLYREKYVEKETAMKNAYKIMEDISKKISLIEDEPPDSVRPGTVNALKMQKADHQKEYEKLRNELKEIEKEYYDVLNPVVSVSKAVYPGTIIKIKHARYEVKEELPRGTFKLAGGDIIYSNH